MRKRFSILSDFSSTTWLKPLGILVSALQGIFLLADIFSMMLDSATTIFVACDRHLYFTEYRKPQPLEGNLEAAAKISGRRSLL